MMGTMITLAVMFWLKSAAPYHETIRRIPWVFRFGSPGEDKLYEDIDDATRALRKMFDVE